MNPLQQKKHPKIKFLKTSRKILTNDYLFQGHFHVHDIPFLKSSWYPQMSSMQAAIGKVLQRYADFQPFITILGVSSASHLGKILIKKSKENGWKKSQIHQKISVSTNQRNLWKPSTALWDKFLPFAVIRPDSFPLPVRLCSADQNFGTSIDLDFPVVGRNLLKITTLEITWNNYMNHLIFLYI